MATEFERILIRNNRNSISGIFKKHLTAMALNSIRRFFGAREKERP